MKKLVLLSVTLLYMSFCGSVLLAQSKAINPKAIGPLTVTAGDGMLPTNDVVKNIALSKELSTFCDFINKADLTTTFQSRGPITIFVPANDAFNNLPVGKLDSLMKHAHVWELTSIISYHAIPGKLKAKDIEKEINKNKGLATFITLAGSKLTAKIDANRNIVLIDENGNESIISRFDIEQNNGMLHVVNKVLLPKPRII
ncbi:fasciclin domain-containing protein [Mucilaginibacter sp. FT3.2]|uniref:fasciclin domain-containing protein n=1 Tax=Mucilaginibacter sp. FT3.2 TaxID=2723090 RepID=UPI00160A0D7C|nr:fasciclin domain-containing protein [Mucilaginibacter sp. FT3.2]MBB6234148.1 putative surface protein with fasciclin (FAS1) repeats [Mucilaginibacter sp. FT3.2]